PAMTPVADVPERMEGRPEGAQERPPLADRFAEGGLDVVEGRLQPHRQVGKDAVGALYLLSGERGGARGIASDGDERNEQRRGLLSQPIGEPLDAPRHTAGGDDDGNLRDRDGEGRDGDDAQKHVSPWAHASSRARACWYASRPRSMALDSVSRPCASASRPFAAASAARARPSRAFSPR